MALKTPLRHRRGRRYAMVAWVGVLAFVGGQHQTARATVGQRPDGELFWSSQLGRYGFGGWTVQACAGGIQTVRDPVDSSRWATRFSVSNRSIRAHCGMVPNVDPRAQVVSPGLFRATGSRHIAFSTFFPKSVPSIPQTTWMQVAEEYGSPLRGCRARRARGLGPSTRADLWLRFPAMDVSRRHIVRQEVGHRPPARRILQAQGGRSRPPVGEPSSAALRERRGNQSRRHFGSRCERGRGKFFEP
jgi:hypothetical protein